MSATSLASAILNRDNKQKGKQDKTIKEINKIIRRLGKNIELDPDEFKVAQILLTAALVSGADSKKVASFTKLPFYFVRRIERRLRSQKVWVGRKTACEWQKKEGTVAFWCDVCVGMGWLKRT